MCPTPSDPMDCSPPGPSIHGIFQARVLEWGAIAFSVSHNSRILILFKFPQTTVSHIYFLDSFFFYNIVLLYILRIGLERLVEISEFLNALVLIRFSLLYRCDLVKGYSLFLPYTSCFRRSVTSNSLQPHEL